MLAVGTPDEVRRYTKKVIEEVAADGGYILDASAIVQNDADVTNMQAMTEAGREFGIYSQTSMSPQATAVVDEQTTSQTALRDNCRHHRKPGVCIPWSDKQKDIPVIKGDKNVVQKLWESNDAFGYYFIWQNFMW